METVRCMISFMYNEEYDGCVEGPRIGTQNDSTAEETEHTGDDSLTQEAESLDLGEESDFC